MIRGVLPSITATAEFVVPISTNMSVNAPDYKLWTRAAGEQLTQVNTDYLPFNFLLTAS